MNLVFCILLTCMSVIRSYFRDFFQMRMCCQVAAGLEHLTKLGLVHQDVAARNCVISSKMLIKLTVLSLSKEGFER